MSSNPFDSPGEPNVLSAEPPSQDDRNLALLAHLSGCIGIIAGGLLGFVGPLVIYLMKKDSSSYVATQAKGSSQLPNHAVPAGNRLHCRGLHQLRGSVSDRFSTNGPAGRLRHHRSDGRP